MTKKISQTKIQASTFTSCLTGSAVDSNSGAPVSWDNKAVFGECSSELAR